MMRQFSPTNQGTLPDETLKEYDQVITRVFERLYAGHEDADRLPFTKSGIERAISDLGLTRMYQTSSIPTARGDLPCLKQFWLMEIGPLRVRVMIQSMWPTFQKFKK